MKSLFYPFIALVSLTVSPLMAADELTAIVESEQQTSVANDAPQISTASTAGDKGNAEKYQPRATGPAITGNDEEKKITETDPLIPETSKTSGNKLRGVAEQHLPGNQPLLSENTYHSSGADMEDFKLQISTLKDEVRLEKMLSERIFRLATEHNKGDPASVQNGTQAAPVTVRKDANNLPEESRLIPDPECKAALSPENMKTGPQTQSERESYASGAMLWREIQQSVATQKALGIDISAEGILEGLNDTARNTQKVSEADITASLDALNARYIRLSGEQREKQKESAGNWLKEFRTRKGVLNERGVWFLIDKKGVGPRLKAKDTADLLVTGRLPDGTVFDNAAEKDQIRTVQIGTLLPPVSAGLEKLGKGGHITIAVPPEKAYGEAGLPPLIPGNAMLIFDITVKDVR
ncbi:FKBP-type peptidyl-prolyl cis-trans isomerase [Pantoea sp. SIMBA_133]